VLVDLGQGVCLHIHHWILCALATSLLVLGVFLSGGQLSTGVTVALGLLAGVAASDLAYMDLSLKRFCVSCGKASVAKDWKGRAAAACAKGRSEAMPESRPLR